jgi:hypothetical protein
MYVSDVADAQLFKGRPYHDMVRRMLEEADRHKWLSKYRFEVDESLNINNGHARGDLLPLARDGALDFVSDGQSRQPGMDGRRYLAAANRLCLEASRPLFRTNGRHFARMVLSRVWYAISFYEGVLMLILGALPFLFSAEPMAMLLALFALCHLAHTFLIAVVSNMITRYTFYTYDLMLLAPMMILQRALSMRSDSR